MADFLTDAVRFMLTHSLIIGAVVFILLRQRLSERLSAYAVRKYFPAAEPRPQPRHSYHSLLDLLAHSIPNYIEDRVMTEARQQRVAEQVRRQFLQLVVQSIFMVLIALAVLAAGRLLEALHLITPGGLGYITRLVVYGIVIQNAARAVQCWDMLSVKKVREFYRQYGFSVFRFIEYQIASVVEREARIKIDESVRQLGAVERFVYRSLGNGTDYYAKAISREALDENRSFIRLILLLAACAGICYYAELTFLIAPAVRSESGESFFRYIFIDPAETVLRFCSAHPSSLIFLAGAAALIYHWRARILKALLIVCTRAAELFRKLVKKS